MDRLDTYCGTALLRTMYTKKHLLYSGCLCCLTLLICFNFRSVVNVVSGKIIFTTLLCRELILGKERQSDRRGGGGGGSEREKQTYRQRRTNRQTCRQTDSFRGWHYHCSDW